MNLLVTIWQSHKKASSQVTFKWPIFKHSAKNADLQNQMIYYQLLQKKVKMSIVNTNWQTLNTTYFFFSFHLQLNTFPSTWCLPWLNKRDALGLHLGQINFDDIFRCHYKVFIKQLLYWMRVCIDGM